MGLIALFVRLGSRNWADETNRRSALLGERLKSWSLLLAAVPDRATVRDVPKGSDQASRAATTLLFEIRNFEISEFQNLLSSASPAAIASRIPLDSRSPGS